MGMWRHLCWSLSLVILLSSLSPAQVGEDPEKLDSEMVNPWLRPAPPDGSPYIYARWTPSVIYADGKTSIKLEDNGDGTYKATIIPDQLSNHPFTKLTLYMMGLVPPDEVPPAMFLTEPDYPNYDRIPASKFDSYTIDEIIAANGGERQPAYPKAQKRFKMGFIVVTDHKPTPAECDFFAAVAKYFASKDEGTAYLTPFYTATEGRAKMVVKLPKVK